MELNNNVIDVFAPTEEDMQGYCPHCGADVMSCFNKKYCGNCRRKITWNIESNDAN